MTLVVKNTFLEFEFNEKARDRDVRRCRASSFPASSCRLALGEESDDGWETEVGSTVGTDVSAPSFGSDALNHGDGWPQDSSDFESFDSAGKADDWAGKASNLYEEPPMSYSTSGHPHWSYAPNCVHVLGIASEQRRGLEISQAAAAWRPAAIHTGVVEHEYYSGMMAALQDHWQASPAARFAPAPKPQVTDWGAKSIASGNSSPKHRAPQAQDDSPQRAPASPGRKQWSGLKSSVLQNTPTGYTTLMLRNLPNDYTRNMLVELLESSGFDGCFDFVYLPFDFRKHAGLGYAFVNMINSEEAQRAMKKLTGFRSWKLKSCKVLSVTWSTPLQGLEANIERYRNSPVMHPSVPEQFKPLLLHNGTIAAFPPPTKALQAPCTAIN